MQWQKMNQKTEIVCVVLYVPVLPVDMTSELCWAVYCLVVCNLLTTLCIDSTIKDSIMNGKGLGPLRGATTGSIGIAGSLLEVSPRVVSRDNLDGVPTGRHVPKSDVRV